MEKTYQLRRSTANKAHGRFPVGRMLLGGMMSLAALFSASHSVQAAPPGAPTTPTQINTDAVNNIQHIIVIYQENWTFDALYGSSFPNANGISNALTGGTLTSPQLDKLTGNALESQTGQHYYNQSNPTVTTTTPPAPIINQYAASTVVDPTFLSGGSGPLVVDTLQPFGLPGLAGAGVNVSAVTPAAGFTNYQPFFDNAATPNAALDPTYVTGDIYHRYLQEQSQINGGALNMFVSWSDDPGLVLSHFDATNLPEGILAQNYTISDNFFHSAFGGSYLNHQFLIAGHAPVYLTASGSAPSGSILSAVDPTSGALSLYGVAYLNSPNVTNVDLTNVATTQNSPTVTAASNAGLVIGAGVSGTSLPAGAIISSTSNDGVTFTISVNAAATTSGGVAVQSGLTLNNVGTTNGTKNITTANTTGLYVGMPVLGNAAISGTITGITNSGTFTVSANSSNTTSSGTAVAYVIVPTGKLYATLANDSKVLNIGSPSIQSYLEGDVTTATYNQNYVMNTCYSINLVPYGTTNALGTSVEPSINDSNSTGAGGDVRPYYQNIGDVLSGSNVSWKWYSGGWNDMLTYSASNTTGTAALAVYNAANNANQYQWHHQAFAFFDNYAPFDTVNTVPTSQVGGFAGVGTGGLTAGQSGVTRAQNSAAHLQDVSNFFTDVQNNTLPQVVFIKPVGVNNEHPGYSSLQQGQAYVANLVQAVQNNPALWAHTAIIITYDEHGGRWDHVTPPRRDVWGPGVRVPLILISPYAQKGIVDHTQRDTSAILTTIESKFLGGTSLVNGYDGPGNSALNTNIFNTLTTLNLSYSGFTVNHRTNKVTQVVTVTNLGSNGVNGPIQFVLDHLSSNTTLSSPSGTTTNSSPYVTVASILAPGASASVTLQFSLPTSGGITYIGRTGTGSTP